MTKVQSLLAEPIVNGTILGRSANLWVSAISALINLVFLFGWYHATGDQIAGVNLAVIAVVALLATARENALGTPTPAPAPAPTTTDSGTRPGTAP